MIKEIWNYWFTWVIILIFNVGNFIWKISVEEIGLAVFFGITSIAAIIVVYKRWQVRC